MWFPARAALFFTLITAVATAAPNQFVTRYLPIGISGSANLLAVAIPCHRVVKADGSISGYRWGVQRKRRLINIEGVA